MFIYETYLFTLHSRYAKQYIEKEQAAGHRLSYRTTQWKEVTLDETWTFIGLFVLTGLIQKGRLESYWTTDEASQTPYFPKHMARNRFQSILKFFHFANNSNLDPNDCLAKVRHVYDMLSVSD